MELEGLFVSDVERARMRLRETQSWETVRDEFDGWEETIIVPDGCLPRLNLVTVDNATPLGIAWPDAVERYVARHTGAINSYELIAVRPIR